MMCIVINYIMAYDLLLLLQWGRLCVAAASPWTHPPRPHPRGHFLRDQSTRSDTQFRTACSFDESKSALGLMDGGARMAVSTCRMDHDGFPYH